MTSATKFTPQDWREWSLREIPSYGLPSGVHFSAPAAVTAEFVAVYYFDDSPSGGERLKVSVEFPNQRVFVPTAPGDAVTLKLQRIDSGEADVFVLAVDP